jgi:NAD+ synthase
MTFDPAAEADRIGQVLRGALASDFARRGYVVAMSGGVDSAVCAALSVRAVGPEHVLGLMLPERESDARSLDFAMAHAAQLGMEPIVTDITASLEGVGCYANRDAAIRRLVPSYTDGWTCKLVMTGLGGTTGRIPVTALIVQDPSGEQRQLRLGAVEYRQIVAATNCKQRVRTMLTYYHADRLHYAVVGTPNRLEYDQGFFVKGGDGLADIKPIAHLYKTQVYALAEFLDVPSEILRRPPTTDTFPLAQTQEEFYYIHAPVVLDQLLRALDEGESVSETARALRLGEGDVREAWRDIARKRSATEYLHSPPVFVETVTRHEVRTGTCAGGGASHLAEPRR